uniref:Uncharacterized protein n=1 Tax=Avena sativa TaxID=4498 RepID=A0ACD5YNC9_AVESA
MARTSYAMLMAIVIGLALVAAARTESVVNPMTALPRVVIDLIERGMQYGQQQYSAAESQSTHRNLESCALNYDSNNVCSRNEAVPVTFFHEEKVRVGETLSAYFQRATIPRMGFFLQRRQAAAQEIPFAAAYYPEILARLRIPAQSEEAEDMLSTLRFCDNPPNHISCVTSYEAMAEQAAKVLGTPHVRAMSSVLPSGGVSLQSYTVKRVTSPSGLSGSRQEAEEFVACHPQLYPYAVFACHRATNTTTYLLDMENSYGSGRSIKLLAICHRDTSAWDKGHFAFDVLASKPGGLPICHGMPYGHVAFGKLLGNGSI